MQRVGNLILIAVRHFEPACAARTSGDASPARSISDASSGSTASFPSPQAIGMLSKVCAKRTADRKVEDVGPP